MLVLRRRDGQWIEVTHRSGDVLWIRVSARDDGRPGSVDLAFDDPDHHFTIQRPERAKKQAALEASCRAALESRP